MSASNLTQQPLVGNLSDKLNSSLDYAKQLPLSFWRNILLVVSCIWMVHSGASLFWLLFPTPEAPMPTKLATPVTAAKAVETKNVAYSDMQYLEGAYGTASEEAIANAQEDAVVDVEATQTTKLNLKLHGVIATDDPLKGNAIIADGSEQALYRVGEDIKGTNGVKLAKVEEKRVILDNRGNFESLWLYSEEDFKVTRRANPSNTRPRATPGPIAPRQMTRNRMYTPPSSANVTHTTATRDQLPKNVGDVVRFSVHRDGGKMVGYRIRPGRDRELFNQVGLKPNDIVTSVNGIEVNDPKQIRSVYKSMKTATQAQLTVLRDGQTHSISISLGE